MYHKVKCSQCGQLLEVDEELFGQDAECPVCGVLFKVSPVKVAVPDNNSVIAKDKSTRNEHTGAKERDAGARAVHEVKETATKAVEALKILFSDPVGGQREALLKLGPANALKAGIGFIILFQISNYLLGYTMIEGMLAIAKAFGNRNGVSTTGIYMKLLFYSLIPSLSLIICYLGIGRMFSSVRSDFPSVVFTAGVSALPLVILFFSVRLFGMKNFELIGFIGVFTISTTVLLVYSALKDIYGLNSRKCVLLTPAVLLMSAYISKVIYVALLR